MLKVEKLVKIYLKAYYLYFDFSGISLYFGKLKVFTIEGPMVKLGSYVHGMDKSPVRLWLGPPSCFKHCLNLSIFPTRSTPFIDSLLKVLFFDLYD